MYRNVCILHRNVQTCRVYTLHIYSTGVFQMGILCLICTISISTAFFRNRDGLKRDLPVVWKTNPIPRFTVLPTTKFWYIWTDGTNI